MAINPIQFQKGLSLRQFMRDYGTDEQCEKALEKKYSHRYLAEVQYRFNRRGNLAALVSRLAVAATQTRPCPKKKILRPSEVWT